MCSVCAVVFLLCVSSAWSQVLFTGYPLEYNEGDECNRTGNALWTCQRLENCPSARNEIKENKRPKICTYDGKTPIVCCKDLSTPTTTPSPTPMTVTPTATSGSLNRFTSIDACQRYQQRCLNTSFKFKTRGNITVHAAIGGKQTAPKEFPHMVLIGYGNATSISWACGGSLISEQYVLSAAHCTNPGVLVGPARWARLGDLNIATNNDDAKPIQLEIISRINHPGYKPPQLYNDIALYKLNQSVTFSPYISPACLQVYPPLGNEKVIATGWGRIGPSGPKSKHLMKVEIEIIPQDVCSGLVIQEHQLPRGIDEKTMICAGVLEGGIDTCAGDSGGPLTLQMQYGCVHQQIGITSFGRICGAQNSPGVYTRLSKYIPWIESIVWP